MRRNGRLSNFGVLIFGALAVLFVSAQACVESPGRPNIVWLSIEDASPHLGSFGDPYASTPVVDRLASEGVRYTHAFTTAGVCAPSRSAIITGMYQTSLGTHHMRSDGLLPDEVRPFPAYLREAGYYCTNNSKEDYQFQTPDDVWDDSSNRAHWKNRPDPDQPFFAVFNYTGCHESGIADDEKYRSVTEGLIPHDRSEVAGTLPPYYPDTPVVREDWGRYYDVISAMDRWVGERVQELEEAGLADRTIVIFWSDHGVGLPRAKRWLYDSGIRVPLVVRIPERFRLEGEGEPGAISDELVSLIDLGPTMLNLAGQAIPSVMQGQPFLGKNRLASRDYIYAARDRMDERYDIIRAVRDRRFKYIRNYEPFKPYYQYMNTAEKGRTMQEIRRVEREGTASPGVAQFLAARKPVEELYDTVSDPHEMQNLAASADFSEVLERMREAHEDWVMQTGDLGLISEAELMELQTRFGSGWGILRAEENEGLIERVREAAALSLDGEIALPQLSERLGAREAAVRFWAATGIGNLGREGQQEKAAIELRLEDPSESVRIAAARALIRMGDAQKALPVLVAVLDEGSQWARVQAAVVLDEADQLARPVVDDMKRHLGPRPELVQRGKYTVRVLNRALNELLGTDNEVE
ncbi:MAG: sulfatase-like hydrolase/transferase [Acidobacteriota bacterium]|nr:MAG: sulfatase-like hydrolase/transferase [Acidobacteriota bacterium]